MYAWRAPARSARCSQRTWAGSPMSRCSFVARSTRALNRDGLRISGRADFTARVTAATEPADLPAPELVIVACKGSDLEAVADRLVGEFGEATVMTIQN